MSLAQPLAEIVYPESDGKPMAETDVHLEWMITLRDMLKHRYRGQQVYVGANLLVYFVEGDPHQSVAPDGFVVKDCDPGRRRVFKTWVEGRVPDVVFEVTSNSTRREDEQYKPQTYARMGVKELFLYDPTGDYLQPPLVGFRFHRGRKTRIRPDGTGALQCRELGLHLRLERGELRMYDARTGERVLTEAQSAYARADAEREARDRADARARSAAARAKAEREAREAERAAREAAEEELRRLRAKFRIDDDGRED